MRFARSQSSRHAFEADLTPLIDVVMQLLIFFMFASQFVSATRSPVRLPEERGEERFQEVRDETIIDVDPAGAYLMNSVPATFEEIKVALGIEAARTTTSTGRATLEVLVRADRDAPAGAVNALARELSKLGVRSWRLGTAGPEGGAR